MPNPLTMAILGGTAAGGYLGFRHFAKDQTMDASDKLGSTVMSAATGGALLGAGSYVGFGRIGKGITLAGKAGMGAARMLTFPKTVLGRKAFSLPKGAGGPLGVLALTAATIGLVAAGSRTPPASEDQGGRDYTGGPTYSPGGMNGMSVKERMGLLGATGDMVFGMNNSRHG